MGDDEKTDYIETYKRIDEMDLYDRTIVYVEENAHDRIDINPEDEAYDNIPIAIPDRGCYGWRDTSELSDGAGRFHTRKLTHSERDHRH